MCEMFASMGRFSNMKTNLITNDIKIGDLTGSSQLLVPGRVISSTRIAQGALSMPINPKSLVGETDVAQISVGANAFGTLELEESSKSIWNPDIHWVRALRLADDCHSYNIQLRKLPHHTSSDHKNDEKPKLVLQAVRPIEAGQELLLWFSEDLSATLHMGFLTPANIQGQKNYVCLKCSTLYESPNPLKIHLTLGCGTYKINLLWETLATVLEANKRESSEFRFKLVAEPLIPKQKNAIDLSAPSEKKLRIDGDIYKPYTYNSAFKPFQKIDNNNISNRGNENILQWPRFTMPQDYMHTPLLSAQTTCDNEAQMESLVSSLGKFKEGHICLYCGKSYSRKYGLKIHIRTHTGYKPLKCKFCMRPFGDPSNLNKHVRLHAEGETPYKCELCGKILVRRRDLERHLKSRHVSDMNPITTLTTDEESNSIDVSDEDQTKTEK